MATKKTKSTPKKSTPHASRASTILYVRIPRGVHDRLVTEAKRRGWPHTVASVSSELISKALS